LVPLFEIRMNFEDVYDTKGSLHPDPTASIILIYLDKIL